MSQAAKKALEAILSEIATQSGNLSVNEFATLLEDLEIEIEQRLDVVYSRLVPPTIGE